MGEGIHKEKKSDTTREQKKMSGAKNDNRQVKVNLWLNDHRRSEKLASLTHHIYQYWLLVNNMTLDQFHQRQKAGN